MSGIGQRTKVLAPIRAIDELEMLLHHGAEEFYCGIVPQVWMERFNGPVWLNRRSNKGSSLETFEDMKTLVDGVHAASTRVFVTLNAPYYSADQIPMVLELARTLSEDCGVDALIVADLNLMLRLCDLRLHARLHVSSVAATLNREAVEFLMQFAPERIILPRSVTLEEIAGIARAAGDRVEIEAFVLNDGCAFEEGLCATTHHHSVGGFCTNLSDMKANFAWRGPRFTARRERELRQNLTDYREWIWYVNGNGCGATPKGLPYGPCGLCAVADLACMGVASLKIVGREASPFKKMASVRMVRDILDRVRKGDSKRHTIERAIALREQPEHCQSGYMCYYKVNANS